MMRRCRKHEPEPSGELIEQLRGDVICKNCGAKGMYSRGSRKFGRPRRVIWFRDWFAANTVKG